MPSLAVSNYKDYYFGSILDPIHGDIKLSEIEKWVISQPLFSRLRYIRQNTFLYYVFPSANHTRFEHSIGVMQVAGRLFDACIENFATASRKFEKYKKQDRGSKMSFYDIRLLGKQKEELFYQELRLADLMHDLGHGPMSHLFDEYSLSKKKFLELLATDPDIKDYLSNFDTFIGGKEKIEHETMSCVFAIKLIKKIQAFSKEQPDRFSAHASMLISRLDCQRVVSLIEPALFQKDYIGEDELNYSELFARIISGFPTDADRMDYLLRDSYFAGVTYGIYDINRVFASFVAFKDSDNKINLCFKESGIDSMVRFIQSRTHLYNQVYSHKTNSAANAMLKLATRKLTTAIAELNDCSGFDSLIHFYEKTTDESFIRKTIKNIIKNDKPEVEVLGDLICRRLFKRIHQDKVYTKTYSGEKERMVQDKVKAINFKLRELEGEKIICCCELFINISYKDSDKKNIYIAIKGEPLYNFSKDWKTHNAELEAGNINIYLLRFFLKRDFENPNQFEERKERVKNFIKRDKEELLKLLEGA